MQNTIEIGRSDRRHGNGFLIAIIANFNRKGKPQSQSDRWMLVAKMNTKLKRKNIFIEFVRQNIFVYD